AAMFRGFANRKSTCLPHCQLLQSGHAHCDNIATNGCLTGRLIDWFALSGWNQTFVCAFVFLVLSCTWETASIQFHRFPASRRWLVGRADVSSQAEGRHSKEINSAVCLRRCRKL